MKTHANSELVFIDSYLSQLLALAAMHSDETLELYNAMGPAEPGAMITVHSALVQLSEKPPARVVRSAFLSFPHREPADTGPAWVRVEFTTGEETQGSDHALQYDAVVDGTQRAAQEAAQQVFAWLTTGEDVLMKVEGSVPPPASAGIH